MRHFLDINLNGIVWTQELKGSFVLGRHIGCDIVLNSPYISRIHATLVEMLDDNNEIYYRIIDGYKGKRSTAGLIVNGCKVEIADLKAGDRIDLVPLIAIAVYQSSEHRTSLDTQTWTPKKTSILL